MVLVSINKLHSQCGLILVAIICAALEHARITPILPEFRSTQQHLREFVRSGKRCLSYCDIRVSLGDIPQSPGAIAIIEDLRSESRSEAISPAIRGDPRNALPCRVSGSTERPLVLASIRVFQRHR